MKFLIDKTPSGYFTLTIHPQLEEKIEARKIIEVIKFLADRFQLETEVNMLDFGMPPYYKFKVKDDFEVTVALDDYFGLSIDSNSREFLEKLITPLEQSIFATEFGSSS